LNLSLVVGRQSLGEHAGFLPIREGTDLLRSSFGAGGAGFLCKVFQKYMVELVKDPDEVVGLYHVGRPELVSLVNKPQRQARRGGRWSPFQIPRVPTNEKVHPRL
jgi:hypothetical protein